MQRQFSLHLFNLQEEGEGKWALNSSRSREAYNATRGKEGGGGGGSKEGLFHASMRK